MYDVLISYAKKDKKWADAACSVLESHGLRCWIAPRDFVAGMEWGAAIIEGIEGCTVMVLIFSSSANASPRVRREVELAISKGRTVVPCRIENVEPEGALEYALGNTHWLDAFTPPVERQMNRLAESVQAILSGIQRTSASAALLPAANARRFPFFAWSDPGKPHWAIAGLAMTLLVAACLTAVFWPRNSARSAAAITDPGPENTAAAQLVASAKRPGSAPSATMAPSKPSVPLKTGRPPSDYDQFATGRWIPALATPEAFKEVFSAGLYKGAEPQFHDGGVTLQPARRRSFVLVPRLRAKNLIIRAQVQKILQRGPARRPRPSTLVLGLRGTGTKENYSDYAAVLQGRSNFGIGRIGLGKPVTLASHPVLEDYAKGSFEFAFAAIDDTLTAYVNGKKIVEFTDPELARTSGTVRIGTLAAGGVFRNIEVQILDNPTSTAAQKSAP